MSSNVATNLHLVLKNVQTACEENGKNKNDVRLVAVSKTKPNELLLDAYDAGHRHFGENYVQELVQKAHDLPNDIHWHFIGPLQSNKANLLIKSVVPKAASLTVETVSTLKLANKLNNAMAAVNESENSDLKLSIFIQVNTSGEISKSGVTPSETLALCREIVENCPLLEIRGLMTIGASGDLNCFDILRDCRDQVQEGLGVSSLELSMGMSGDYQEAIKRGATNVRVGSTIFGERDYSNKE
jgi:pyridoxal phosphate enzyme (YggS family)